MWPQWVDYAVLKYQIGTVMYPCNRCSLLLIAYICHIILLALDMHCVHWLYWMCAVLNSWVKLLLHGSFVTPVWSCQSVAGWMTDAVLSAFTLPLRRTLELVRDSARSSSVCLRANMEGGHAACEPWRSEIWENVMCVWLREECVDRQSVPPCQTHWGEPGDVGGVRGAGQRLSCSVNTSHGEGIHRVKRHISSSDFLPCGDKFRLQTHSFYSLHINQRGFSFFLNWI